jgi:hypothetical protein
MFEDDPLHFCTVVMRFLEEAQDAAENTVPAVQSDPSD